MSTGRGSGGSPILLYSNHVIGIHLGSAKSSNLNFGTFIGELIKEFDIPNQLNLDKNSRSRDKNKIFVNNNNSKLIIKSIIQKLILKTIISHIL